MSEIVKAHRVCVEFDGVHVLENIDLEFISGEFIALLGPNGSGKSTLVRALLGLQPIEHGSVRLFDIPLARFKHWDEIALVPQRLPGASSVPVSVWETVLSGLITPKRRWRRFSKAERERARGALESVQLWNRRHDRLDELSGGQQRRALIARALVTDASFIILDEPTAGVDAENVAELTRLLADMHAHGATVLVVTHELDEIEHLVTRAIVLDHGSVMYDGPTPLPIDLHDHFHHHHNDADDHGLLEP